MRDCAARATGEAPRSNAESKATPCSSGKACTNVLVSTSKFNTGDMPPLRALRTDVKPLRAVPTLRRLDRTLLPGDT